MRNGRLSRWAAIRRGVVEILCLMVIAAALSGCAQASWLLMPVSPFMALVGPSGYGAHYMGGGDFFGISPNVAGDGATVVFAGPRQGSAGDVFSFKIGVRGISQLTDSPAYEGMPSWSPDGKKIVFISERDNWKEVGEVWIMNADGTSQTQLTHDEFPDVFPFFSPDGRKICYTKQFEADSKGQPAYAGGDGDGHIFMMNADGTSQTQIGKDRLPQLHAEAFDFSPDGRSLLFLGYDTGEGTDLWLVGVDGTNPRQVEGLDFKTYRGRQARFSPDGKEIIFLSREAGLCIFNLGSHKRSLISTGREGSVEQPSFFPNGQDILFTGKEEPAETRGLGSIWALQRNGQNLRRLLGKR